MNDLFISRIRMEFCIIFSSLMFQKTKIKLTWPKFKTALSQSVSRNKAGKTAKS